MSRKRKLNIPETEENSLSETVNEVELTNHLSSMLISRPNPTADTKTDEEVEEIATEEPDLKESFLVAPCPSPVIPTKIKKESEESNVFLPVPESEDSTHGVQDTTCLYLEVESDSQSMEIVKPSHVQDKSEKMVDATEDQDEKFLQQLKMVRDFFTHKSSGDFKVKMDKQEDDGRKIDCLSNKKKCTVKAKKEPTAKKEEVKESLDSRASINEGKELQEVASTEKSRNWFLETVEIAEKALEVEEANGLVENKAYFSKFERLSEMKDAEGKENEEQMVKRKRCVEGDEHIVGLNTVRKIHETNRMLQTTNIENKSLTYTSELPALGANKKCVTLEEKNLSIEILSSAATETRKCEETLDSLTQKESSKFPDSCVSCHLSETQREVEESSEKLNDFMEERYRTERKYNEEELRKSTIGTWDDKNDSEETDEGEIPSQIETDEDELSPETAGDETDSRKNKSPFAQLIGKETDPTRRSKKKSSIENSKDFKELCDELILLKNQLAQLAKAEKCDQLSDYFDEENEVLKERSNLLSPRETEDKQVDVEICPLSDHNDTEKIKSEELSVQMSDLFERKSLEGSGPPKSNTEFSTDKNLSIPLPGLEEAGHSIDNEVNGFIEMSLKSLQREEIAGDLLKAHNPMSESKEKEANDYLSSTVEASEEYNAETMLVDPIPHVSKNNPLQEAETANRVEMGESKRRAFLQFSSHMKQMDVEDQEAPPMDEEERKEFLLQQIKAYFSQHLEAEPQKTATAENGFSRLFQDCGSQSRMVDNFQNNEEESNEGMFEDSNQVPSKRKRDDSEHKNEKEGNQELMDQYFMQVAASAARFLEIEKPNKKLKRSELECNADAELLLQMVLQMRNEKESLQEIADKVTADLTRQKRQVEMLQNYITFLAKQRREMEEKQTHTAEEMEFLYAENNRLSADLKQARKTLENFEQQIKENEAKRTEALLERQINIPVKDEGELKLENKSLRGYVTRLLKKREELTKLCKKLKGENQLLKSQLEANEHKNAMQRREDALKVSCFDNEKGNQEIAGKISHLETENTLLKQQLGEKDVLEKKGVTVKKLLDALRLQISVLKLQYCKNMYVKENQIAGKLDTSTITTENPETNANQDIDELIRNCRKTKTKALSSKEHHMLEGRIVAAEAEIQEPNNTSETVDSRIPNMTQSEQNENLPSHELLTSEWTITNQSQHIDMIVLHKTLEQLETDYKDVEKRNIELVKKTVRYKTSFLTLRKAYQKKVELARELKKVNKNLTIQISTLLKENKTLDNDCTSLDKDYLYLKRDYRDLKREYEALKQKFENSKVEKSKRQDDATLTSFSAQRKPSAADGSENMESG